jgi:phage baseplate assembly protein W
MGVSATGGIRMASGEQDVEECIRLVLGTALGERPMRPEYGCGIHDLVFAPSDTSLVGLIGYEVRKSLQRWEPRIDVVDVNAQPDPQQPDLVLIDVSYRIRATNDRRNLVVPFYAIPKED